jgi:hypothetical protein
MIDGIGNNGGNPPDTTPVVVTDDELDLDMSQKQGVTVIKTDSGNDGKAKNVDVDKNKGVGDNGNGDDNGDIDKDKNKNNGGNADDNTESTVLEDLIKLTGFTPTDETGKTIVYDNPNDIQTLAKYAIDSAKIYGKQAFVEEQTKFMQTYPLAKDVWDAMIKYNINDKVALANFLNKPDYSSVTLNKDNEAQLIDVITKAEVKRGRNEQAVKKLIDYYKADNSLFIMAEGDLSYLQAQDKAEKEMQETIVKNKQLDAQKEINDYWGSVDSLITSRKIGEFTLPEQIKVGDKVHTWDDFKTYIQVPTENGYTAYQNEEQTLTTEEEIWRALLSFTKGSISTLVTKEVASQKAKDLKARIGRNGVKSDGIRGLGQHQQREKVSNSDLDI